MRIPRRSVNIQYQLIVSSACRLANWRGIAQTDTGSLCPCKLTKSGVAAIDAMANRRFHIYNSDLRRRPLAEGVLRKSTRNAKAPSPRELQSLPPRARRFRRAYAADRLVGQTSRRSVRSLRCTAPSEENVPPRQRSYKFIFIEIFQPSTLLAELVFCYTSIVIAASFQCGV